ncbi:hypothetical protein PAXINDRAFT_6932 [Paxillus involutus ATCC 200175]|nr:hypothetical protein PAXINDRAFT_6932 [Paxillus involutus ATCC 200175]
MSVIFCSPSYSSLTLTIQHPGKGLKLCSSRLQKIEYHNFVSHRSIARPPSQLQATPQDDAHREVFLKTVNFYCALVEKGCVFVSTIDYPNASERLQHGNTVDDTEPDNFEFGRQSRSCRRCRKGKNCRGQLVLCYNIYQQPFIQCSNFTPATSSAHLVLRNLQEFNTEYLRALLDDDQNVVNCIEQHAKTLGIGPLAECNFTASPCEQKQLCSHWHRDETGHLH